MTLPAIPDPATTDVDMLPALMRQVIEYVEQTDDLAAVDDTRARTLAFEDYVAARHPDHVGTVREAARLVELRLGQLLGPASTGRPKTSLASEIKPIDKSDRYRFRRMAEHEQIVRDAGGVTRARVLDLIDDAQRVAADTYKAKRFMARNRIPGATEVGAEGDRSGDGWAVYAGDFRDRLDHLVDAVDLVVTDPPYADDALDLFGDLAEWAATAVRPGGVVVVYTGTYRLPAVLDRLRQHLTYRWCFALDQQAGSQARYRATNVVQRWKPVLICHRDPWKTPPWGPDVLISPAPEKDRHPWQQNGAPVRELIERYSAPGWVVADPFLGGGTTGYAALDLRRQFIGADIDGRNIEGFQP